MPPTPFQPSHQTPFKSTVSSSQQSRVHHTPFESEPSTQISISDIDPSEWTYHAEGGKNVLLSFKPLGGIEASKSPFSTPTYTFALRIPKSLPPKTAAEAQQQDEEQQAEQFTNSIIVPLLGNADVLPKCIRIPIMTARDRDIIDTLSARIEMQRPAARRAHPARIRPETLSFIYAVQDVTASTLSAPSSPVLCVEIKPKWGFLPLIDSLPPSSPNVEIKAQYSRYRMHRVARMAKEAAQSMTTEQFEKLYDPLDLYSADEQRKAKAISALWRDWNDSAGKTNNLRLFWNGHVVSPHDKSTLEHVAEFLGVSKGGDENTFVDALTRQLVAELSKPSLPSPTADAEAVSVLSRLAQLQSALDPLDVEGLAQLWLHRIKSHTLGQVPANTQNLPPALTSSLAVSDLLPILESFLTASSASGELRLEDAVQAFLVSASFKDCSLLIRVSQVDGGVESETKLVDLDRKPFAKLSSMQNTDNEVCAAFIAWLSTLSEAPPASIAP